MPRKKKEPSAVDAAREAGRQYVQDQISGDYFRDWVWDQMVEAEAMRQRDPNSVIPLESPADYRKLARNMLQQLGWDIDRDLDPRDVLGREASREEQREFVDGLHDELRDPNVVQWVVDEVMLIHEEVRRGPDQKTAPEEPRRRSRGIRVGKVVQIWEPEEGAPDDMEAYVQVDATMDGKPIKLGTVIGVPPHQRETARRAGGDTVGPYLSTWWADSTDWQDVPADRREEAESALKQAAPRLWREVQQMRGAERRGRSVRAPQRVQDYVAVDTRNRVVAGPFKDYGQAKREADRAGGHVRFVMDRGAGKLAESTGYHVYAEDGFESAHRSERAALAAARRGSQLRPGVRYDVVKTDAHGLTGRGHGHRIASYLRGVEIDLTGAREDPRDQGYDPDSKAGPRRFPRLRRVD
jgi:hypothetical protein